MQADPVIQGGAILGDATADLAAKWTAVVSVDAAHCAANSTGHFEIGFSRLKEIGHEVEFREGFAWAAPAVRVDVDFWADEAVERFWIENITPCPCPD